MRMMTTTTITPAITPATIPMMEAGAPAIEGTKRGGEEGEGKGRGRGEEGEGKGRGRGGEGGGEGKGRGREGEGEGKEVWWRGDVKMSSKESKANYFLSLLLVKQQ